jgi:putative nucleotidyltransferase with HDIG domain
MSPALLRRLNTVNRELWVLLTIFVIAGVLNFLVASGSVVLNFYMLPTLFSAYAYGRRHAVLTALGSVLLAVLVLWFNPALMASGMSSHGQNAWFDVAAWGGILLMTSYVMGTLYERSERRARELRQTYQGVLMILRQFISKDQYTQNHSYRVSVYAATLASGMGLDSEEVEDIRAAALLHDIGKLDISRELLHKAAKLTNDEYAEIQTHVEKGARILEPVGGSLSRIIPIVLAHHDKFDGNGYNDTAGLDIPLGARILAVADNFDAMTSDRPYRKAMSPFEAKEIIEKASGRDFDPEVVKTFLRCFSRRELEVPEFVVN